MMVRAHTFAAALAGAAVGVLALAALACGGSSYDPDATPVAASTASDGGAQTVTIVAENIRFYPTKISARPGTLVVTHDQRDAGLPHNLKVFAGDDADGESIAESEIEDGPTTQTLTLELAAGVYYYHCDVHPSMRGTIEVSD
jgi:plastocyanin